MRQLLWMLMVSMAMMVFTGCDDGGSTSDFCDTQMCDNAWEECSNSAKACVVKDGMCNADADCADMADSKTKCEMTSHACYDANNFDCATACTGYLECNVAKDGCQLRDGMCNTDADCTEGNKTECNDSNTCVESDTCVDNATRCSSDGKSVETCASNAWTAVACDADLVCEVEGDAAKCVVDAFDCDTCVTPQKCNDTNDACIFDCDTCTGDKVCNDAKDACVDITDTCTDDAKRCNTNGQLETCASNAWTAVDCDAGSTCKADGDTFACVVDAFDCDTCLATDHKECNDASDACVCMADYHMDGDACVSDSKMVACVAPATLPTNGSAITVDVEVKWESDAWTTAETCDWKCADGYTKTGDECVLGYDDPCLLADACGDNEDCTDVDTDGVAECACSDGFVSVNGACVAFVCEDGSVQCNDTAIEMCTLNAWVEQANCATNNQICEATSDGGAQCVDVVVCTENDTRCTDDMLSVETCTNNAWVTVACTNGDTCKASGNGFACLGESSCTGMSIESVALSSASNKLSVTAGDYGFQIEFYGETPANTYNLASDLNSNYASCLQCVQGWDNNDKTYFQESGSLTITAGDGYSDTGESAGSIANVVLVESTFDEDDNWTTTPVENGTCVEIQTAAWDTMPVQCTENDTRCAGATIETCQADGSWAAGTDCSTNTDGNTACEAGACVNPNTCETEGATQCNGMTVQTCTDGLFVDTTDCSANTDGNTACEAGACVTPASCENDNDCLDEAKPKCNSVTKVCIPSPADCDDANINCGDGSCIMFWGLLPICECPAGQQMTDDNIHCEPIPCTEGDLKCNGDVIETCNADGITWSAGTNCADSSQVCTAGQCIASGTCVGLSVPTFEPISEGNKKLKAEDQGMLVTIGFYGETPVASYDLTSEGVNDNFETCAQCVLAQDANDNYYFQSAGSLEITSGDANDGNSVGSITSVKLVEVTLEGDTSTPTNSGKCIEIETGSWDTRPRCTPDETKCNGTVLETCAADELTWETSDCAANTDGNTICVAGACANPNACETEGETLCDGAIVRTCTNGLLEDTTDCSANTDGMTECVAGACVAPVVCTGISFDAFEIDPTAKSKNTVKSTNGDNVLSFEFFAATPTGEYNLVSMGENDNYKTCNQCAMMRDSSGESVKRYYASEGSLTVTAGDAATTESAATVVSLKLIEVTQAADFTTTPVEGGDCFDVETAMWNTMPTCVEGTTRCSGDMIETCDDANNWVAGTDCAATDGDICLSGACVTPECKEDFDCASGKVCKLATGDNFRTCVDAIVSPECTENADCTNDASPACDELTKTCRAYYETCDNADCGVGECVIEDGYYPACVCPEGTYMSEDQMHCLWAVCDDDGGTNNDVANATPIETLNGFTGAGHICSGEQEYYVINQALTIGDTFTLTLNNSDFTAYLGISVDGEYKGYVSTSNAGTLNGEIIDLSGNDINNPTWMIVISGPRPSNDDYSFTIVQE